MCNCFVVRFEVSPEELVVDEHEFAIMAEGGKFGVGDVDMRGGSVDGGCDGDREFDVNIDVSKIDDSSDGSGDVHTTPNVGKVTEQGLVDVDGATTLFDGRNPIPEHCVGN
ncbi:unnamed protein product [Camellia sinensis]